MQGELRRFQVAVKGALATTKGHSQGVGTLAQYFDVIVQRVASAHEFAFLYKSKIHLKVPAEMMKLSDAVNAELISGV